MVFPLDVLLLASIGVQSYKTSPSDKWSLAELFVKKATQLWLFLVVTFCRQMNVSNPAKSSTQVSFR